MISQERVRPTGGTLPQMRVLPLRGRHLDLGLTSTAIMSSIQVGEVMNHAEMLFPPFIMTFWFYFNKKIISARFKRCIVGACVRRRNRIILSQKGDVVANHTFMTTASVVYQSGAVIVPDEATFVPLNEPAKRQDGWAPLQEENPRGAIEPPDLVIHHICGGSGAVRSGHMDHGSVMLNALAKLVRKWLLTNKMKPESKPRIQTGKPSHDTDTRAAATANASADALVCQGFAGSGPAAAFGAAAPFDFRTGMGAAIAGASCSILHALP